MDNLARAKKAFIEADKAGNKEDAQFFLSYIQQHQASVSGAGGNSEPEGPGFLRGAASAIGNTIVEGLNPFAAGRNVNAARDPNAPAADVAKLRQSQALAQGTIDGLTLGLSDEMIASPQAAIQGRGYGDVVAERDAATRALRQANPGASMVGNLAGGLATGGMGAARVLGSQAVRSAAPLVRGAASAGVGTTLGATSGAGYAEPGQRGEGAIVGGTLGGALGAAVPAAGRIIGAGVDKVRAAVSPKASEKLASDFIARYAGRDAIDPATLGQRVAAKGPEAMPVDLGRNLEALGEHIANRPGAGMANAIEKLGERNAGQTSRIMTALKKAANITDDAVDVPRDPRLRQQFTESLGDLVDVGPGDTTMLKLLGRPSLQKAWDKARVLAKEEGAKMPKLKDFAKNIREGNPTTIETRQLHWLKKGLDDVLEPKRDPVTGRVVSDVGKNQLVAQQATRKEFRDILREKSPRYAEALDNTAGELKNLESYRLGGDALRKPVKDVVQQVGRLSDRDLDAYRRGFVEAVEAATSKSDDLGFDISRQVMDSKRLKAVFGDKGGDLMKVIRGEREMRQTAGRISGNSRTAYRSELAKDMEGGNAGIAGEIAGNPTPGGLLSVIVKRMAQALTGERRPPERAMEAAAKVLFNSDPADIQRIIGQSRNITNPVGARPSDIPNWLVGIGAGPLNPEVSYNRKAK